MKTLISWYHEVRDCYGCIAKLAFKRFVDLQNRCNMSDASTNNTCMKRGPMKGVSAWAIFSVSSYFWL